MLLNDAPPHHSLWVASDRAPCVLERRTLLEVWPQVRAGLAAGLWRSVGRAVGVWFGCCSLLAFGVPFRLGRVRRGESFQDQAVQVVDRPVGP